MYSDQELLKRAETASYRAYAPYSGFRVGAAVLLEDGTVIEGSNQECSAYGLCMCAERVALHYAHSAYPHLRIERIAIFSPDARNITPCGSCRQVMAELTALQKSDFMVTTPSGSTAASELLPCAFRLKRQSPLAFHTTH